MDNNCSIIILVLCFIILSIIFYLITTKKNKENFIMNLKKIDIDNYNKYIEGEKVDTVFSDEIVKKIEKEELYYIPKNLTLLYRLYKEIMNIDNFDLKLFMELIYPYSDKLKEKFGIFKSLHPKRCIEFLYKKREKVNLNENQKKSLEDYYEKMVLIDMIHEIINKKKLSFINCEETIEKYFKTKYPDNNLMKNFSFFKFRIENINHEKLSVDDLLLLKHVLESLPEQPCEILDLILDTTDIRNKKIDELKICKRDLSKFINDQYKFYGIKNKSKSDNVLTHDLIYYNYKEVEFIRDLYKFILNCEDLKKEEKDYKEPAQFDYKGQLEANEYLRRKARYNYNLKKSINKKKIDTSQIKTCLKKMKNYMDSMYDFKNIHKNLNNYPLERLNRYNQEELEKIDKIYDNIPKCSNIDKEILINTIYKIYDNILEQSNDTYGCKYSIDLYFMNNMPKMINLTYKQFKDREKLKSLPYEKVKKIYHFIKNTPPCLDITYKDTQDFDKRNADLLLSYDYVFDKAHVMDNVVRKNKVNQFKVQGNRDVKAYHPNLYDHKDYPVMKFQKIMEDGKNLDKFYRSQEFQDAKCRGNYDNLDTRTSEDKLKDALSEYLREHQNGVKGVGSIYSPSIEIDSTQNLSDDDIKQIEKQLMNMNK